MSILLRNTSATTSFPNSSSVYKLFVLKTYLRQFEGILMSVFGLRIVRIRMHFLCSKSRHRNNTPYKEMSAEVFVKTGFIMFPHLI